MCWQTGSQRNFLCLSFLMSFLLIVMGHEQDGWGVLRIPVFFLLPLSLSSLSSIIPLPVEFRNLEIWPFHGRERPLGGEWETSSSLVSQGSVNWYFWASWCLVHWAGGLIWECFQRIKCIYFADINCVFIEIRIHKSFSYKSYHHKMLPVLSACECVHPRNDNVNFKPWPLCSPFDEPKKKTP